MKKLATAATLFALALLVTPLLYSVWISFSPGELLVPPGREWSLRWYEELFARPEWTSSILQSAKVGAMAVVLACAGGTSAAVGMARLRSGAKLVERAVLLPLFCPAIVLAMGLLPLVHELGLYGSSLGIAMGHALWSLPVVVLVVRRALDGVDPELERAALGLGAGPLRTFLWVTLPIVAPAIAAGALIAFVLSLNEFEIALFLATPEVATLPRVIWPNLRYTLTPLVAAASTIMLLCTTLVLVGFSLLWRRR
ncbi:MAG: ABC transporter permease [Polyangia bacterium]